MKLLILICTFIIGCTDHKTQPKNPIQKLATVESPIVNGDFSALREALPSPCIAREHPLQGIRHTDFIDRFGNPSQLTKTITECTLINNKKSLCPFNKLDFLFQAKPPTIENILDKTVVKNTWVANNFETLLHEMPAIILHLFSSVTSVIIHPHIHSGFFFPATGALYLSSQLFALTDMQKKEIHLIHENKNFCTRKNGLTAHYLSRYIKDNGLIFLDMTFPEKSNWRISPIDNTDAIKEKNEFYTLASLLFHELAHANDFYPVEILSSRNADDTPDYLRDSDHGAISTALYENFPLVDTSGLFSQRNLERYLQTPSDIPLLADLFMKSAASDIYSFHSAIEDTAILFEELMMKHHFDVDREVAFASPIPPLKHNCANITIYSGSRSRHLLPNILPRALFVAEKLDPQFDAREYKHKHAKAAPFSWCKKNE